MAGPRIRPKLDVPRPVYPGIAHNGPTGSDIINRILNLRKEEQVSKGTKYEVPTTDILRTAAMGSDDDRALLRQIWDAMPENQQLEIKRRLIQDMPSATHPSGLDEAGNQVFSTEAQKILDVLEGRGLDATAAEAARSSGSGSVPKSSRKGPTENYEGKDATGSYEPDYEAGSTGPEPEGGTHSKAAAEDVKGPSRLQRNQVEGFDPNEAGVHDPGKGQTSVEGRPHFRVTSDTKIRKDGSIVRKVDEESSSYARKEVPIIRAGEKYEDAMAQRQELFANLLVAQTGSRQNAAALMSKAQDGDPDARALLAQIKVMVNSEIPKPRRPGTLDDFEALNTEQTPQAQLDRYGEALITGSPTNSMYTPRRGKFDTAMAAWQALQISSGTKALVPNQVFSSPRQMAEQYVRNMSPELFDMNPVTPSQRMDAGDTVRQFGIDNPEAARQYIAMFGDAPTDPAARASYREQAIDRMAKEFQARFGDQWGEGARTGTPVGEKIPGTDEYDPASMSPAPLSSEPASPSGTSTSPDNVPYQIIRNEEGGSSHFPNQAGTKERKSFEQMLAEHIEQSDALQGRLRGKPGDPDSHYNQYLNSDDYLPTPVPPKSPEDWSTRPVDSPVEQSLDSFDPADHGEGAAAALEKWKKRQAERGWEVTAGEEGTFSSRPKAKPEGEEPEFEGTEAHWKGMDKDQKLKWSYPDGATDWMADHNARYPMTPDDQLAKREELIQGLTPMMPGLAGAGRTSEILKQIDELEAGEWSPAVDAQITALKKELVRAQRADSMTGVQSAKKPPLGGKVGKVKGKAKPEAEAVTGNPADTTPVQTTQQKVMAEDDAPAIDNRPETPKPDIDNPESPDYIPPVNGMGEPDGAIVDGYPDPGDPRMGGTPDPAASIPATQAEASAALGMDDYIDPLDSAHPSSMDPDAPNPLTADTDAPGPSIVDEAVSADAAAKVDEAEAPRDAEASRPPEEASTIPEDAGNPETATDAVDGKPQKQKQGKPQNQVEKGKRRFPWRGTVLAGAGVAGLYGLNHLGSVVNQQNAAGQDGLGGGMPGGAGGGLDAAGGLGAAGGTTGGPDSDPYGYGASAADRIREMQRLRNRVPTGIPQTLQQWR